MASGLINAASLLIVLALSGCGDRREVDARNDVKTQLIDAESARFQNIRIFENGNYCGQVNAKNRMGGYTGFVEFSKQNSVVEIDVYHDFNLACRYAEIPLLSRCDSLETRIQLRNEEAARKEFEDVFCESLMKNSSFKR